MAWALQIRRSQVGAAGGAPCDSPRTDRDFTMSSPCTRRNFTAKTPCFTVFAPWNCDVFAVISRWIDGVLQGWSGDGVYAKGARGHTYGVLGRTPWCRPRLVAQWLWMRGEWASVSPAPEASAASPVFFGGTAP